jgi:hypothetical protein
MLNRRYGRFYAAAENALFNSMISILYKVFETRDDTVNFWQLRKTVPSELTPEVQSELGELYARIKSTWIKVSIIRNNVVGHQSIEVTAEKAHEIAGVTFAEIRGMIGDCQHLLYLIAKYFQDTHVIFNLTGTQTFDRLLADLRKAQ